MYYNISLVRTLNSSLQDAQRERALYRDSVREAAEGIADFRRPDGPIPPLQNDFTKVHYTFDYSQMVTLPHHYRQMGPLYFVRVERYRSLELAMTAPPDSIII